MPRLAWQAASVTPQFTDWLSRYPVGGIILFGNNVSSVEQVQKLTTDLQAVAAPLPLFIAIDEEGGRVSRVGRLFDDLPAPAAFAIGNTGDTNVAYEAARTIGRRLMQLGVNMNFAPVADVWTNPSNTVIGNRAFGSDAYVCGEMVAAFVRGLHAEGIFSVVKHFPGHGDTYEDSHYRMAFYPHGRERFDTVEAVPFLAGIAAGADGVMAGHISTPLLQNEEPVLDWMGPWLESGTLPATFSDFWLQDVLRGEMGFDGLIITDALDMRALTDHFTVEQIALGAFLAGADILLMPTHTERAFYALLDAYHTGVFTTERLHDSLRRILNAKEGL
ncbi:MAG: glycoside hydrolase family 3 protein [Defluviitaleaceae bacterium]|nr:glycoside hydrolase family 3 protein [Defluviitaleaceae bacterium]